MIELNKMGHFVYQVNTELVPATARAGAKSVGSFLYDQEGNRKYLTRSERNAFLGAARTMASEVRTFCLVLAYCGARISEVLALTPSSFDPMAGVVIFESLKKRRRGVFRAVPVPRTLFRELDTVHSLELGRKDKERSNLRIWPWSRTTAWKRVQECMQLAGIVGPQATPRGLRHGFGVGNVQAGVPISLVKKWLGHSRLTTTEIYVDAVGPEEQAIAERFWRSIRRHSGRRR